jgi:hypothetical protein
VRGTKGTSVLNRARIYCGTVRETIGTSDINCAGIYCGTMRETIATSVINSKTNKQYTKEICELKVRFNKILKELLL